MDEDRLSPRLGRLHARMVALREGGAAPVPEALLAELDAAAAELAALEAALARQTTALTAAQQATAAERRRCHDLFERAPDGYLVTDTRGIIRAANRAASALLNSLQQFLIGKPLAAFLAPEESLALRFRLLHLADLDRAEEWEVVLRPPQRPPFPAVLAVAVVREWGEPAAEPAVALRWMVRDVSAQRRLEATLRRAEEQAEASRLEGVALTARALAHLLDGDLGLVVRTLELLRHRLDLPADLRARADEAQAALDRTVAHVAQLQQVVRVETRATPLGPALDLPRSL